MPGRKRTVETFNDGVLTICKASGRSITMTKMDNIRFGNRVVGVKRFYEAKVVSDSIDRMVAILPVPGIGRQDVCLINGEQYKILQIQDKFDHNPPCLYLSLEWIVTKYKDARE